MKRKFQGFNPNGMAVPGRIFGLPHNREEAKIYLVPGPSAITLSCSEGAELGPAGLLEASAQIELFNNNLPRETRGFLITFC